MSVYEEAKRNTTGRFNSPLEFYSCTNSIIYHEESFNTYMNFHNKMYPDVV